MSVRRTLSVGLSVIGVACFVYGSYVSHEATVGESKISEAEANAAGQRKPLLGPIRKSVRAHQAEAAQQKIGDTKAMVAGIEVSAKWLQGSGIVLAVVGLGSLLFSRKRKSG